MAKNNNLTDFLTDLATGIRNTEASVTGTTSTAKINPQNFRSRVEKIYTDNTAARANTTISITADDTNDKLTITASNNQSSGYVVGANTITTATVILTASGANVTATAGDKSVTKSVGTATHTAPTATLDTTTGKVTTKHTATAGYVSAGTTTATLTLSTVAASTITPGTQNKTAVAQGKYTLGTVTVKGDADLVAANIKKGVEIFGVTGTFTSDATAAAADIYTGKTAYVNGTKVTGTMPTAQLGAPNVSRNENVITFSGTISQAGYLGAGVSVAMGSYTMPSAVINKPEITISSSGLITAQADSPDGGYIQGPFYTKTKQLSTKTSTDLTANGPTVSIPSGYYPAGLSKTVTTVARGTTTVSAVNGGSNAITISAANTQATGYVTGSTASSSAKVYVTRTNNTVYLRQGSTAGAAIISLTVPTTTCPVPTITLNTTTGVITAKYTISTAGYATAATKSSSLTIKLAEDNAF